MGKEEFQRDPVPVSRERKRAGTEDVVRCKRCNTPITNPKESFAVDGNHTHDFVNPAGLGFTIRTFREAPGATTIGDAETFFTWFPGHAWRIALCAKCGVHLGWRFESSATFYGFIVDRLAE
jgi:hypothetical protein